MTAPDRTGTPGSSGTQAAGQAAPEPCEHHWVSQHKPGHAIYWVRLCGFCGDPDWDDLDREIAEAIAAAAPAPLDLGDQTAGQLAYEGMAQQALSDDGPPGTSAGWDALESWQRTRWHASAKAVIGRYAKVYTQVTEKLDRRNAEIAELTAERDLLREQLADAREVAAAPAGQPTREQVIARLAAAFGPHKAAVSRKPDEDHRHPWTEFLPSGLDERGSTLIVFRDEDGQNSMRPLTYGEIADALCGPAAESASAPQPEVGDDIAEAEKVISRYREQVSRLTADNERMQDALREALDAEQPQAAPGADAAP